MTTTDGQVQSLQLPAGAQGVAGPQGPTGADGIDGVSLTVLDEGINPISTVSMLDFTGEGVVVSDEGSGRAQVQIDGATPLVLFDEGNRLSSDLALVMLWNVNVPCSGFDDVMFTVYVTFPVKGAVASVNELVTRMSAWAGGGVTPPPPAIVTVTLPTPLSDRAIDTNVGNIDFVGDGVVVSDNGVGSVTVTIAGGGELLLLQLMQISV